ncbi:hypothetical protein MAP00_006401 [Monascus purpureus]|nr:hypothetical protein MAP00_006401 [Monascus purpureus]
MALSPSRNLNAVIIGYMPIGHTRIALSAFQAARVFQAAPGYQLFQNQIREKIPRSTAYSSTPVTVDQINPPIEKVVTKCGGSIEYLGGHSVIALFSSERIAMKMSFKAGGSHLSHERNF